MTALHEPQERTDDCLLLAAHVLVVRALESAGGRMCQRVRRISYNERQEWNLLRDRAKTIPLHLRHTQLPVSIDDLDRLLDGAWHTVSTALPSAAPCLVPVLDDYVRALLLAGQRHEVAYLRLALDRVACHA